MISLFTINVQAFSGEVSLDKENNKQIEELYNYITNMKSEYEILKDMNIKDYVKKFIKTGEGNISAKKVVKAVGSFFIVEMKACLKLMISIIIIAITCALITNLERAFSNENLSNIAYFACYALLIIIMARSFYIGVDLARETIRKMTNFMLILLPVLLMLLFTIGGTVQATTMDPVIVLTINIAGKLFSNILIPIISATFVLQFVNNISEDFKIDKLTSLLNKIVLWGQGILMTIFIGIITVRGITSETLDKVVAKTAKFAVDNFVPIVGKCLSDAISTVAGYSILLKNALGSIGLIILIVIVLFPTIKILISAFLYKTVSAFIEPIADKRLVNCISSAGNSLILITSCVICVSVMFFIMVAIVCSAGKVAIGG